MFPYPKFVSDLNCPRTRRCSNGVVFSLAIFAVQAFNASNLEPVALSAVLDRRSTASRDLNAVSGVTSRLTSFVVVLDVRCCPRFNLLDSAPELAALASTAPHRSVRAPGCSPWHSSVLVSPLLSLIPARRGEKSSVSIRAHLSCVLFPPELANDLYLDPNH